MMQQGQGLAAQGAELTPDTMPDNDQGQNPAQDGGQDQILQQVVQALMQGTNPDDLLKQGVPKEIIMQAIQIIQQQMAQQQQGQQPQGLAGMQA